MKCTCVECKCVDCKCDKIITNEHAVLTRSFLKDVEVFLKQCEKCPIAKTITKKS